MLDVVIIGAGPGGLSAAARCAVLELNYQLLEASPNLAKTIFDYQKNKPVMAEPSILPLRSDIAFEAGRREEILDVWENGISSLKVNVSLNSRVTSISGTMGEFAIVLESGETLQAKHIVLAIGLQGNPRQLGVDGENPETVQYTLVDASEFKDEKIVVVGAGDAAIENAIALSSQNEVTIVNRRDEFARAKDGNLQLIRDAIKSGKITCIYNANAKCISKEDNESPFIFTLKTPDGPLDLSCHRIIARLGAIAPRGFLESFGVGFPNDNPNAIPVLSESYESNIPGLFIIGALAGNPLIKQAMNQGYEVVQTIVGEPVEPADQGLLREKIAVLPFGLDVIPTLALFQKRIPFFSVLSSLQFRELMMESQVIFADAKSQYKPGDTLFEKGDFSDSFITVVDGELTIIMDEQNQQSITLTSGQFFGELGLNTGQRRNATARLGEQCVIVETPRRVMVKLINSNEEVKKGLDAAYIVRALQLGFTPSVPFEKLIPVAKQCKLVRFKLGETIFSEGDPADLFYLVRAGSVTLYRQTEQSKGVFNQVRAGEYLGESALMGVAARAFSAQASNDCELVAIDSAVFKQLVQLEPDLIHRFQSEIETRAKSSALKMADTKSLELTDFLLQEGMKEATDLLVINDDLCIGCDNCETACAETHDGTSRFNRAGGKAYASVHVPISCRHCEVPHCMKDCPPDAIKRDPTGEVYIDDTCIGCGNCETNCPYDVIKLAYPAPPKPSLMNWLFFGLGSGPGQNHDSSKTDSPDAKKKAVKCDACREFDSGPACVRACPTGAAIRIEPKQFDALISMKADASK
tara:strand:- start:20859 stop:23285 length:2427 start_codon:yes stop_codon:yes gene_type:complete